MRVENVLRTVLVVSVFALPLHAQAEQKRLPNYEGPAGARPVTVTEPRKELGDWIWRQIANDLYVLCRGAGRVGSHKTCAWILH